MQNWTLRVPVLAGVVGLACGTQTEDEPATSGDEDGKFDDIDDIDESACTLDDGVARALVHFVNNDHVQFRCRGPGGSFVATGCCKPQIEEFVFATGCPLQAKFDRVDDVTSNDGRRQRCVADFPDSSENVGVTELVATSCCKQLCDGAEWDDPAARDRCRDHRGQFTARACCEMNDVEACGDATWETRPEDEGLSRCRAQSGEFAGKYAVASCCMDECFRDDPDDAALDPIDVLPIGCLVPSDNECAGANVTGMGACALALTADQRQAAGEYLGDWGKAMCCAGQDGLDMDVADECFRRERLGGDLSICG